LLLAGALVVVAGWLASCAWAKAGRSNSPAAAAKTVFKRKTAVIAPALSLIRRSSSSWRRRANARRVPLIQALGE
jgi:hypothetical protein